MTLDRSAFKATSTEVLREKLEQDKMEFGVTRTNYISLQPGNNYIRLLPKFPSEDVFMHLQVKHWGEFTGKDGGIVRGAVPNARVSGVLPTDPIEAYIQRVQQSLNDTNPADKEVLAKLVHWKDGLVGKPSWYAYAYVAEGDKVKEMGILEMNQTVNEGIKAAAAQTDSSNSPISVDPFTDLDSGRLVVIKYDQAAKGAKKYVVTPSLKEPVSVPDEVFNWLVKQKPISEIVKSYNSQHFNRALEIIQNFDDQNELGIMQQPEFQALLDQLSDLVPDAPKEQEKSLEDMTRDELKLYIKERGLGVKVVRSLTDDNIRELITVELQQMGLPLPGVAADTEAFVESEPEEPSDEPEDEELEDEPPVTPKASGGPQPQEPQVDLRGRIGRKLGSAKK